MQFNEVLQQDPKKTRFCYDSLSSSSSSDEELNMKMLKAEQVKAEPPPLHPLNYDTEFNIRRKESVVKESDKCLLDEVLQRDPEKTRFCCDSSDEELKGKGDNKTLSVKKKENVDCDEGEDDGADFVGSDHLEVPEKEDFSSSHLNEMSKKTDLMEMRRLSKGREMNAIAVNLFTAGKEEQALFAWRFAASVYDNAAACFNLGLYYEKEKDVKNAAWFYGLAVIHGNPSGRQNLECMIQRVNSENLSHLDPFDLLQKAVDVEFLSDEDRFSLLEQASNSKYESEQNQVPNAEFYLGICYERGLGVDMDRRTAAQFYKRASKSGHAAAKEKLAEFEGLRQNEKIYGKPRTCDLSVETTSSLEENDE